MVVVVVACARVLVRACACACVWVVGHGESLKGYCLHRFLGVDVTQRGGGGQKITSI